MERFIRMSFIIIQIEPKGKSPTRGKQELTLIKSLKMLRLIMDITSTISNKNTINERNVTVVDESGENIIKENENRN